MAKQTFTSGQTLLASQMNSLQANDYNWTVSTQTANYTLQAADKGTREVMNMASAGTVTVPNATFDAGDIVWVHSIGSGTISVVAGSGMTLNSSAGTAPTLAQWEGGVVYFTSASSSIFFRGGGVASANFSDAATGTYSSGGFNYKYLTFNASGSLTVTRAGFADILVVAGGGGGGGGGTGSTASGGGGGGGHLYSTDVYLPVGTLTVTVGAGGAGGAAATNRIGNNGNTSQINNFYSPGGGAGGTYLANDYAILGFNGGSGGGGGSYNQGTPASGGSGVSGLGNAGGSGAQLNTGAGGGGGAGGAGGNASGTTGGTAGTGLANSITGASVTRAAGGAGGSGGVSGAGAAGTANSGNGGGGGNGTGTNNGGAGGSGVVIVRVKV